MLKVLRTYQEACMDGIWNCLMHKKGHYVAAVAGGGGKSLLMAELMKRIHLLYPRTRILSLVHTQELLKQNSEELLEHYPSADFGFYCASLKEKKLYNDITFASIQSVHNKIDRFNRCPEVIIVDECDMIPHNENTQYRKFIDSVLAINPNCKIVGFTGTYWREDDGLIYEGENALFDGISYEIGTGFLIEEGFLVKPTSPKNKYQMDTSGVPMRGCDFVESQLQEAIDIDEVTKKCIDDLVNGYEGKIRWLGMASGIQHCEHVTAELISRGFNARMITGDTGKDERKKNISWFKEISDDIRILVNVGTLNVGLNVPALDLLFIMRPTRSKRLYTQFVWRCMRPLYADGYDLETKEGRLTAIANSTKPEALLFDFGGVVDALGCIDVIDVKAKYANAKKEENEIKGDAIVKRCPSCNAECAGAQRYCYECSYSFVANSLDISASNKAVVSADIEPEEYKVMGVEYKKHIKRNDKDAPPSMVVEYVTMAGVFREWVCFEHHVYPEGNNKRFAWKKAQEWHRARDEFAECPMKVEDAVNFGYQEPEFVVVKKEGKYDRVIGVKFDNNIEPTQEQLHDIKLNRELEEMDIPF